MEERAGKNFEAWFEDLPGVYVSATSVQAVKQQASVLGFHAMQRLENEQSAVPTSWRRSKQEVEDILQRYGTDLKLQRTYVELCTPATRWR